MTAAAAEIEDREEAFAVVADRNRELEAELRALCSNHEHTLDFLARWRELLVALQAEQPGDMRLVRALAGEHPMRPAPWGTPRSLSRPPGLRLRLFAIDAVVVEILFLQPLGSRSMARPHSPTARIVVLRRGASA